MGQQNAVSAIETLRLPAAAFLVEKVPEFIDVFDLLPMFDAFYDVEDPPPVLLMGPKGIAKSLGVRHFAYTRKIPLVTYDCSEDVRRNHLIGQFVMGAAQTTPFMLGALTTAIDLANETGAAILDLEELGALSPQMMKVLNPLTDFRRRIEVPECKRVFALEPGKKLWVVGTTNTSVYGGVYALNEDLKSRFRIVALEYPSQENEVQIVKSATKTLKINPKVVAQVLTLAHETRQKAMEYALAPRDVTQILEDIARFGLKRAIRLASGKFEGTDRDTFMARAKSIFDKEALS